MHAANVPAQEEGASTHFTKALRSRCLSSRLAMPWSDFQMPALKCSDWGGTGGLALCPRRLWKPLELGKGVLHQRVSSAMRPTTPTPLLKPVRAESALDQNSILHCRWALGSRALGTEAQPSSLPTLPGSFWGTLLDAQVWAQHQALSTPHPGVRRPTPLELIWA